MIGQAEAAGEHPEAEYLVSPRPRSHAVQFYDRDEFLRDAVARYVGAGLHADQHVLAIATRAHNRALVSMLEMRGHAVGRALESGQLVLVDVEPILSQLIVRELPDPVAFHEYVARALAQLRATPFARGGRDAAVRVYGEMVDLLAQRGNLRAAIRLEELWTEAIERHGCSLLCGHDLDSFRNAGDRACFEEICRLHRPVLPTERYSTLPDEQRLLEVCRLQQQARALESELEQRTELEAALRAAREAHTSLEEELRVTIKRERDARGRVEASHAFKEAFLGMLGHDLRNPLNVILTTARR